MRLAAARTLRVPVRNLATKKSMTHDEMVAATKKHSFFSWSVQGATAPISMVKVRT